MTKRALLIGINDYQYINKLQGCINDVNNINNLLLDFFNFKKDNITILKNKEATKKEIIEILKILIKLSEPEDYLFFYFSGFGSKIYEEYKNYDSELICPYNMNWKNKTYINCDEFKQLFYELNNLSDLEIIFDCCYTNYKSNLNSTNKFRSKFIIPPYNLCTRNKLIKRMRKIIDIKKRNIFWSACKDNQISSEAFINFEIQGAFTYCWTKAIKNKPKGTKQEILEKTIKYLRTLNCEQTPQLEIL
jgi:metacaspase-1